MKTSESPLHGPVDITLFVVLLGLFIWALFDRYRGSEAGSRQIFLTAAMVLNSAGLFVRQRDTSRLLLLIGSAVLLIASFLLR